jgi:hypothetical protein
MHVDASVARWRQGIEQDRHRQRHEGTARAALDDAREHELNRGSRERVELGTALAMAVSRGGEGMARSARPAPESGGSAAAASFSGVDPLN